MTQHSGRMRQTSPSVGRARLGAAVLLASAAVLTGCGAGGGDGGAASSTAAATTTSPGTASSTAAEASGSASSPAGSATTSAAAGSSTAASSSTAAQASGLPAGMNADVELPENEKVLTLKEPMAEALGLKGDVTVDTTATGEFASLQAQQQEEASDTDEEAARMRAEAFPALDEACWAAQAKIHGLLAETGGTEVSYSGARTEPGDGQGAAPDASVLITTLPDEAAAQRVQQAEEDRQSTCGENPDYAAQVSTERTTVDGAEYDVTTLGADSVSAGLIPGATVTTRDGARLIAVTLHEGAGAEATPEQVLEAAQAVRTAVAEEFGPAS